MLPRWHILLGGIVSLVIWLVFPSIGMYAWVVFLSSFLIDVDHYMEYVVRQKDISLINALRYYHYKLKYFKKLHRRHWKKYKEHYIIFHTIESWIVLAFLGMINPIFWFVLLGFGIHMFFDYIAMLSYRVILVSKISLIATYVLNRDRIEFDEIEKL